LHNLADKQAGHEVDWINIADARALTELGLARRNRGGWETTTEGLALIKAHTGAAVEVQGNEAAPGLPGPRSPKKANRMMDKKQIKADEYRRLAREASAVAHASGLENVRQKHELAAARWTSLAEQEEWAPYAAPPLIGLIANGSATIQALCGG
jgi:hypothetical protein